IVREGYAGIRIVDDNGVDEPAVGDIASLQSGKIASAKSVDREVGCLQLAFASTAGLIIEGPKSLVLSVVQFRDIDGTAHHEAELVLPQGIFLQPRRTGSEL